MAVKSVVPHIWFYAILQLSKDNDFLFYVTANAFHNWCYSYWIE